MPAAIILVKEDVGSADLQQNESLGQRLDEFSRDKWEHIVIENELLPILLVRLLKQSATEFKPDQQEVETAPNRTRRPGYNRNPERQGKTTRIRLGRRIGE